MIPHISFAYNESLFKSDDVFMYVVVCFGMTHYDSLFYEKFGWHSCAIRYEKFLVLSS
jgi:hypothetical protein